MIQPTYNHRFNSYQGCGDGSNNREGGIVSLPTNLKIYPRKKGRIVVIYRPAWKSTDQYDNLTTKKRDIHSFSMLFTKKIRKESRTVILYKPNHENYTNET